MQSENDYQNRKTFEQATWKYANEKYPQSRQSILFDGGKLGMCLLEWSGSCGGKWINRWYDRLHSLPNAERIHGGAGQSKQPETPTPLDGAACYAL
jgi:hypothetical protein